jgi:hypothetical protein
VLNRQEKKQRKSPLFSCPVTRQTAMADIKHLTAQDTLGKIFIILRDSGKHLLLILNPLQAYAINTGS